MKMVKIKGTPLQTSKDLALETHGEEMLNRLISLLNEEDRKIFSGKILSSAWYPLDAYVHWLEVSLTELCKNNEAAFDRRIQAGVEHQFRGVYRAFLYLGSAENVLKRLSNINSTYFQGITTDIAVIEKGKVLLTYKGLERRHKIFEMTIRAWWEKVLELMGAKDRVCEIRTSISEGKGYTEFILRWKK
jgi:hypothetical protein